VRHGLPDVPEGRRIISSHKKDKGIRGGHHQGFRLRGSPAVHFGPAVDHSDLRRDRVRGPCAIHSSSCNGSMALC